MSQTMREALALAKEAIDAVEDWSGYAGDYFKEKHKLAEELAEYRARLAALSAPSSEQAQQGVDAWRFQWSNGDVAFMDAGETADRLRKGVVGEDGTVILNPDSGRTNWKPLVYAASRPAAAAPTAEQILALERRSPMSDDEALRFGRAVLLLAERAAAAAPAGGVTPGAYLRKKAEDYAMEYGSDDMGGLSFGSGAHAEVKMDHYNNLLELAEELDALTAAARAAEPDVDPIQAAADASSVGHLSALLDHQTQLLRRAMAAMKAIEGAASPADEGRGDFTATVPYETWAAFVDARASLLHDVAQSPVADQAARAAEPEGFYVASRQALAASPTPPTCTACHGTGRVEEDQKVDNSGRTLPAWGCCDACEGTGKVEQQTPPTGTSKEGAADHGR